MRKHLYIFGGLLCVGLGGLGVVTPGLPTTPFLLLASWLFYRSSPRLQQWLLNSWLGKYIRNYEREKGMHIRSKLFAIGLMLTMCTISIIVFLHSFWPRLIVAIAGIVGTIVVGFIVPTIHHKSSHQDTNDSKITK